MIKQNLETIAYNKDFVNKLQNPLLVKEFIAKIQPYSVNTPPDCYQPDILTSAAIYCLINKYYDSFNLLVDSKYWDDNNTVNTLFGVFSENTEPLPLNSFRCIYFKAKTDNLISNTKIHKLYKWAITNPVLSLEELKIVTGKVPASTEFVLWACNKENPPNPDAVELAVSFTKDNFPTLYKDKICGELESYAKSQIVDLNTYAYLQKIYHLYLENSTNKLGFIQLKKTYKKYKNCQNIENKHTLETNMDYYLHDLLDIVGSQTKKVAQLMGNTIPTVEYLLRHPKSGASVRDAIFIGSCEAGNETVLEYFLTQPGFIKDCPQLLNQGFVSACQNNQIYIARLLMSTQTTPFKINDYEIFTAAWKKQNTEILHYLILELGISKSPQITQFLEKIPNAHRLEELFDKKCLNEKLSTELSEKQSNKSKFKI